MTREQERLFAAVMKEKKTILGVAYRRRVPESDVPDLVQRVLFLAWTMIERDALTVDPSRDVRSAVRWWLGRLAFNESVKMHRARAREPVDASLSDLDTIAGPDETPRLEAREELRMLTYRLNRRERQIFKALATDEDRKVLAARLRVEIITAGVLIHRLRKHLRKHIER